MVCTFCQEYRNGRVSEFLLVRRSKMPCRDDVKKVLIIGSGPIVIGQAC